MRKNNRFENNPGTVEQNGQGCTLPHSGFQYFGSFLVSLFYSCAFSFCSFLSQISACCHPVLPTLLHSWLPCFIVSHGKIQEHIQETQQVIVWLQSTWWPLGLATANGPKKRNIRLISPAKLSGSASPPSTFTEGKYGSSSSRNHRFLASLAIV